ncbi:hypothetical protein FA15DRAFT_753641 [Coprinopsis marcescibilis]|uniref:F-box domain-containing protein n=1 Tax=Coprinopsis marcescibilis TaxID=230819 RepID=A0A5C3L707_COPMA|nr:hypothetical protein FA15DRAFT_753641 [Coprinopsis marcescibilis]
MYSPSLQALQASYTPERLPTLTRTVGPPQSKSLPPELWLEILPHMSRLDKASTSLVSQQLRALAQPMLFEVLDVSPFLLAFTIDRPFLRPKNYLRYTLDRLACFQQPHIVHGIKSCYISPYTRTGYPARDRGDDLDPSLVVNAVIDALPSFPNLRTLALHLIDLNDIAWNAFCGLHLTSLWLNSCNIDAQDVAIPPYASTIFLDHCSWKGEPSDLISLHEERRTGVPYNVARALIRPQRVKFISTPRRDTALMTLAILAESPTTLQSLRLSFAATTGDLFLHALANCPRLTSLTIFPPVNGDPSTYHGFGEIPFNAPSLKMFEGPYIYLPNLLQQHLESVSVWGMDERPAFVNPHRLLPGLSRLAQTPNSETLGHLHITATHLSDELLACLISFKNLKRLSVESHDSPTQETGANPTGTEVRFDEPIANLYLLLQRIRFPPTLERLRFRTRLRSGNEGIRSQEHEAALFIARFVERQPALNRFEIEYGVFWSATYNFVWSRTTPNLPRSHSQLGHHGEDLAGVTSQAGEGGTQVTRMSDCFKTTVLSQARTLGYGDLMLTVQQRRVLNNAAESSPITVGLPGGSQVSKNVETAAALWSRFKSVVSGQSLL